MSVILKNNVEGFLATAISASDTGLVLQAGNGANFPNPVSPDYFFATLVSSGGTIEVVKVTARSGDSMTIVRAQDGTTANSFAAGARVEMRVNAQSVIDTVYGITNYQGASASNPTVRLDGSALQAGDFYFNTSADEVRFYNGTAWQSLTTGSIDVQNFVGTGSQTNFTLSQAPTGEDNTQVYVNGVYQQKDTYSVSGLTLSFSVAPPLGATIEVVVIEAIAIGQTSSDLVSYQPAGVSAVPTTVREKLRETVSVKDFGAVGDGITDDTAAIQAALDSGAKAIYATGTFLTTGNVTLPDGVCFYGWPRAVITTDGGGNFIVTSNSTIENIDFDWNGTARRVYGDNASSITFRNCASYNSTGNGFDLFNGPVDLTFEGCTAYGNGGFGIAAFGSTTQRPNRITVRNCKAYQNYYDGIVVAGVGEKTSPAQTALYARNIVISDCIANENGYNNTAFNGIATPYCQYVTITNCITYANTEHGFGQQEMSDFAISNCVSYGNGQAGISLQSGYDPYNPCTRGVVTGFNSYNNGNEGLALKEQCSNIIFSGCSFANNTLYSVRLRDLGGSGLKSSDITFIGCAFEPSLGSGFVNSNSSTGITSAPSMNFNSLPLQPNYMLNEALSTVVTLDTRGTTFNFPELFILTDSGTDVSRTLINQAFAGRRIILMADGAGAVAIRHNQGDGVTYAGFILQAAATVTLDAYESITFVGNGTNWIQVAANT